MESAFTTRYSGRARVLKTKVGVCMSHATPEETKEKNLKIKEYLAIWDTGATNSVITKKVANDLGLKPISVAEVRHAGGRSTVNVYLVNIGLPNRVMITNIRVSEADLTEDDNVPEAEQSHVLIGMDIIGAGDFAVTNQGGKTTMSFRFPSLEEIDFIPTSQKHNELSVGNRHQRRLLERQRKKGLI